MKRKLSVIFLILLFSQSFMGISANEIKQKEENMSDKIKITIGSKVFIATLDENETVKELKKMLPLTLNMNELNGNEKYFDFSHNLPTNSSKPKTIHSGDLMIWSSNTLVLFYKTFPTPYSYTKIGHIDDLNGLEEALGLDEVTIIFESK
ncbi:cyclophilin domain-containing protein [Arcobacter venerupis]|uniref:Cyclophilin domain-containing protein n=2 Tax=Arcobacter venerupis TaxID=1054033 RepID=A0AAE7BB30_9BACT|nr:cyclophilin domain-containing protein [Arcobacter venerupis]RWS49458.1 hypothetical protein CKA56_08735 [Arcobacter venerupis]